MKESDLLEALGEIDSALVNEAYERLENNMMGIHKGEAMAAMSKKKAIYKIATVLCAAAACILLCFVAIPAIKNAISDGSDEISISDAEYITVQVEEKAMFCPVYAPNGFVMFNAEFEDDPTLGGVIEYSNTKGDVITFSYEKSSEGINATDECEIIGIGDFTGYFNETEGSLTWEENGYILKIVGISDKVELNKMACDVKNKDKISIDLETTTAVSKTTEPIRVTTNRTQAQSQTESAITTTTQQASQQIVHTGTFFVPAITTTATSCGTTHTTVCTTSTVTANSNCSQTVTTKTFTAFGTTTSTAKTTAQTTLPAVTTNVFTTTTTSFVDDTVDVTTTIAEITTTTTTTTAITADKPTLYVESVEVEEGATTATFSVYLAGNLEEGTMSVAYKLVLPEEYIFISCEESDFGSNLSRPPVITCSELGDYQIQMMYISMSGCFECEPMIGNGCLATYTIQLLGTEEAGTVIPILIYTEDFADKDFNDVATSDINGTVTVKG